MIPSPRHMSTAAGAVLVAISAAAVTARHLPVSNHALVVATALYPYLSLAGVPAVALFIAAHRRLLAGLTAALLVVALAAVVPLHIPSGIDRDGVQVRVMTANLRMGSADTAALAASAAAATDVLAVQELTSASAQRLSAKLASALPYRYVDARDGAGGTGIFSRYPIREQRTVPGYKMAVVAVRIQVAGVRLDPSILVGHIAAPWPQPVDDWRSETHRIDRTMQDLLHRDPGAAVIVMGDFNSTLDALPFRRILRNGYRDAATQAGVGAPATYPAVSMLPPVIAIDHVITHGCAAISVRPVPVPGSDHRALQATLVVPGSSGPVG